MNYNDIITLLNAGYTKAEIDAMMQPAAADQAQPAAIPAQPEPEAPEAIPEQSAPAQPAAQPAPAQPSEYERLEALLNKFIGVAQAGNLNSGMSAAQPQGRTATDVLGAVIAPPQKGNG